MVCSDEAPPDEGNGQDHLLPHDGVEPLDECVDHVRDNVGNHAHVLADDGACQGTCHVHHFLNLALYDEDVGDAHVHDESSHGDSYQEVLDVGQKFDVHDSHSHLHVHYHVGLYDDGEDQNRHHLRECIPAHPGLRSRALEPSPRDCRAHAHTHDVPDDHHDRGVHSGSHQDIAAAASSCPAHWCSGWRS